MNSALPPLPFDLPACPYCAGPAEYFCVDLQTPVGVAFLVASPERRPGVPSGAVYRITCGLCGAAGPERLSETGAIEAYRRLAPPPKEGVNRE